MRLTPDLLNQSLSYLNPLKERELDLRGHKIPLIENLAVAGPQDALDLTDNDITLLGNIPLSPRLKTILLARNRVTAIAKNLAETVPNLTTLVLTQNNIQELGDLLPLGGLTKLTLLSLGENPVQRREHYRLFLIHALPNLRFLDYAKIRATERERAKELFGTVEEPTALYTKIVGAKSKNTGAGTFDTSAAVDGNGNVGKGIRVKLTEKERKRVEKMIRNAKSLAEIGRLERELNEGRVPGGIAGGEDDDED